MDTLTIEFDERPETVVTRQTPVTLNEYFGVREAREKVVWGDRKTWAAAFSAFAPFLISWDFDPPATADGMMDLDALLAVTIIDAWISEVRNVDRPLARRSSATDGSPAASPSRPSSRKRRPSTKS